jgi:hypothetical protein
MYSKLNIYLPTCLIQQRSNIFIKESHHFPKTSFYKSLKSFQDLEKSIKMCHAYSYNTIWKNKSFIIKNSKLEPILKASIWKLWVNSS